MEELIRQIATHLVEHPELVEVNEIPGEHTHIIELRVAEEDIGKVIGRRGNTVSAIRTLLSVAGVKNRKRYILEILE